MQQAVSTGHGSEHGGRVIADSAKFPFPSAFKISFRGYATGLCARGGLLLVSLLISVFRVVEHVAHANHARSV